MNLGQTMLVLAAMALLGITVLTSSTAVLESSAAQNESEAGLTAVSLATSILEEATGKMFDEQIADPSAGTINDPEDLTLVSKLGKDTGERYRGGVSDFDDCDDFHLLRLLYRNPSDAGVVPPGVDEIVVPNLRAQYSLRVNVSYVSDTNLDRVSVTPTWHKKITVVVTSPGNPSLTDSLVFASVISYWN
jgi:hypothetical protein